MHSTIYQITTNKEASAYDEDDVFEMAQHLGIDYAIKEEDVKPSISWLFSFIKDKVTILDDNSFKATEEQIQAIRRQILEQYKEAIEKAENEPKLKQGFLYNIDQVLDDYCTFIVIDETKDTNKIERWLAEDMMPNEVYYINATYDYHI